MALDLNLKSTTTNFTGHRDKYGQCSHFTVAEKNIQIAVEGKQCRATLTVIGGC